MENKYCCIFGAGEYYGDEVIPPDSFVIAADGGVQACRQKGFEPDVIIGDFDSLGYDLEGSNVIKLPKMKDDTDTLAAIRFALNKGYKRFILFGCTGGRVSHTLANMQSLIFLAKQDAIGFLVDKCEVLTATKSGFHFDTHYGGFLSVFAAESDTVISEKGLKYSVKEQPISTDFPIGVSNEFIGKEAVITIHGGIAVVVIEKQNEGVFRL